jgi:hypothetical protein
MPESVIRCFVNDRPVDLPAGATAADAVRAFDPELADRVVAGEAFLTDGRGIALEGGTVLAAGAILRAAVSARRARDEAADAHP